MLKKNFLKEKLQSKKTVLGTWCTTPSSIVVDIIAASGVDFIVIDTEHGPINFETAQNMIMACESHNVSAMMRVPGLEEGDILKALDIGSHGLHIPNIMTKADAKRAVGYSKYSPIGHRGFSPFTRAGNYTSERAKEITKIANQNTLLAIHLEGQDAIEHVDEILTIKELDVVFLGLFDLSKSLGIPGQVEDPKVLNLLKKSTEKIIKAKKYAGTIVTNDEQLKKYMDYGIQYVTYSVDCEILSLSYQRIAERFQKLISSK